MRLTGRSRPRRPFTLVVGVLVLAGAMPTLIVRATSGAATSAPRAITQQVPALLTDASVVGEYTITAPFGGDVSDGGLIFGVPRPHRDAGQRRSSRTTAPATPAPAATALVTTAPRCATTVGLVDLGQQATEQSVGPRQGAPDRLGLGPVLGALSARTLRGATAHRYEVVLDLRLPAGAEPGLWRCASSR